MGRHSASPLFLKGKAMSKHLQFSAMLWQINNVETGELHSVHTSLVEAMEKAMELGKAYDVWFFANYNPIQKARLSK